MSREVSGIRTRQKQLRALLTHPTVKMLLGVNVKVVIRIRSFSRFVGRCAAYSTPGYNLANLEPMLSFLCVSLPSTDVASVLPRLFNLIARRVGS